MTTSQYLLKIESLIGELPAIIERLCIAQAQNGIAIVKNRSANNGIFKNGIEGNTADYSTKQISTKRFKGKELNKKGTDYIKNNPLGTWHEFRKAQGLQSEKVNLTYTTRMFTSMGIVKTISTVNGVLVVVSSTDSEVQKYLPALVKRYGNFMLPTAKEQDDLRRDTEREFFNVLNTKL